MMLAEYYDFRKNVKVEMFDILNVTMEEDGMVSYEDGKVYEIRKGAVVPKDAKWVVTAGEIIKLCISQFCDLDVVNTGAVELDELLNNALSRTWCMV